MKSCSSLEGACWNIKSTYDPSLPEQGEPHNRSHRAEHPHHRRKLPSHQQPAHVGSNNRVPETGDSLTLNSISCRVVLQGGGGSYARLFSWSPSRERTGETSSKQEFSLSMSLDNLFNSLLILPIGAALRAGQYQRGNQPVSATDLMRFIQPVLPPGGAAWTSAHAPGAGPALAPPGRGAENSLRRSSKPARSQRCRASSARVSA